VNPRTHLVFARNLAILLDNRFQIFGLRFGIDPILDIVPGLGDIMGALLSLYLIVIAKKLHIPEEKIALMWRHIIIDFLIGLVPGIGVIGDVFYKSNLKNLRIIEENLPNEV
jgi:hypothetical protein